MTNLHFIRSDGVTFDIEVIGTNMFIYKNETMNRGGLLQAIKQDYGEEYARQFDHDLDSWLDMEDLEDEIYCRYP